VIALALVAVIVTFRMFGSHRGANLEVTTATITTGPVVRRIVATGTLQAMTTVAVGAQVSGTIEALGADYNSIVHAGQVVARLDPALFQAALSETEASFQHMQAALSTAQAEKDGNETAVEDARTKLRRAMELGAHQLIPQADLDAAQIAMDEAIANLQSATSQVMTAQAPVDQARAAVEQARVNLDRTVITSPIDGVVIARNVDVGQTLAAAVQAPVLFDIAADVRRMQLEVDIDEADIAGVRPGEAVTFQVESYPNRIFGGTIASVRLQPVIEQTTGTPVATATSTSTATSPPAMSSPLPSSVTAPSLAGTVVSYATIVDVPNADEQLRPGMTATVELTGARRDNAVRVPSGALSFRPPLEVLTAIGEPAAVLSASDQATDATVRRLWRYDGARFTPIDVRVGLADSGWTEIVDGTLRIGDSVVTSAAIAPGR
jgi:HlyD family secretion protein